MQDASPLAARQSRNISQRADETRASRVLKSRRKPGLMLASPPKLPYIAPAFSRMQRRKAEVERRLSARTHRMAHLILGSTITKGEDSLSYRRDHHDPWTEFAKALNSCEGALNSLSYEGALKPPPPISPVQAFFSVYRDLPRGTIGLGQIQSLLKGDAVAPPHGVDLLRPLPIPEFPKLPVRPEFPEGMPQTTGRSLFSAKESPSLLLCPTFKK